MTSRKESHEPARPVSAVPHEEGHRKRLKGKFRLHGLSSLHDYEALELLLFYAVPRKDVKPLAKQLITAFGGLKGVLDASFEELKKIPGMGDGSSLLVRLVREFGSAYLKERVLEREQISCTEDLVRYCTAALGGLKDERFAVIYLNTQNRIIQVETIQDGTVNQAVVHPRKILEKALHFKSSAMILVHNHPSGNTAPSEADIRLTRVVLDAAKIFDIQVHDHLIIGGNRHFSFRSEGLLS